MKTKDWFKIKCNSSSELSLIMYFRFHVRIFLKIQSENATMRSGTQTGKNSRIYYLNFVVGQTQIALKKKLGAQNWLEAIR